jgi:plasmid stabilization system protein ParE
MADVVFRGAALRDLEQIVARIAIDDPSAARRFRDRILARIAVLRDFPKALSRVRNSEPMSEPSPSAATSYSFARLSRRSPSCASFTARVIFRVY